MIKKISIITPVYNAEKYIERCVNSVLNQTYENIEFIIVNDGSTDNTAKILNRLKKNDSRIMVIHKKNEGVSKARNTALKKATGKYVLFVDADDWLESTMCEDLISHAEKNNSDVVICEYYNYYEILDKKEIVRLKEIKNTTFPSLISDDNNKYGGFPWNKLIKRAKIKKDFEESVHYYENLLFFLENFDNNTKYSVLFKPLYNYCINENSAIHSKKFNIKKISTMNALEMIIPLLPKENKINYKIIYVNSYYAFYQDLRSERINTKILNVFKLNVNLYYREIMQSLDISFKLKIKMFIIRRLTLIYYVIRKIKHKFY